MDIDITVTIESIHGCGPVREGETLTKLWPSLLPRPDHLQLRKVRGLYRTS